MDINEGKQQKLTEAEEYEIFLRNQKKYKAQKTKKIRNFFAHILFLIFPGTFFENKFGERIVKNFIVYGLQFLGIVLQISSVLPIITIFKVSQFNLTNFIFNIILALLLLFGGLFVRITGIQFKTKPDISKLTFLAIVICGIVLFLYAL